MLFTAYSAKLCDGHGVPPAALCLRFTARSAARLCPDTDGIRRSVRCKINAALTLHQSGFSLFGGLYPVIISHTSFGIPARNRSSGICMISLASVYLPRSIALPAARCLHTCGAIIRHHLAFAAALCAYKICAACFAIVSASLHSASGLIVFKKIRVPIISMPFAYTHLIA